MTDRKPRYPIYVPSKGRWETPLTAKFLHADGVDFKLVVEPSQADLYREHVPFAELLILPEDNMGAIGSRKWSMEHSIKNGHARHWSIDDNIKKTLKLHKGKRIPCNANIALAAVEEFTDRYTNIGVSGLNYDTFVTDRPPAPFNLNGKVYSASLVNNQTPHGWRLSHNEDTDLCLQMLANGYTTVCFNVYMIQKVRTMTIKGGNTDDLYRGDGRLKMARMLERQWPHVVTTDRRYDRPQHVVSHNWRRFDTPLIRRDDIDWDAIEQRKPKVRLTQVADEIKSERLRNMLEDQK